MSGSNPPLRLLAIPKDDQFWGIVPQLLAMPSEEVTRIILQLSREELLSRFPGGT